jgi:hypothetical protein
VTRGEGNKDRVDLRMDIALRVVQVLVLLRYRIGPAPIELQAWPGTDERRALGVFRRRAAVDDPCQHAMTRYLLAPQMA